MSSKHIINQASDVVHDALTGLSYFNPATTLTYDNSTISTSQNRSNRVKIISGGGSGHAPAHTGFVGDGMLSASVDGMVFASPNSAQVERALNRLLADDKGHEEGGGVLMVVKNYTGDVIQFGLARERSKFPSESIKMIVVGEDVALPRSQGKITGRRGLAATVLTYKIAGALAASGASLDEVETIAKIVASSSGSIGVGLEHCHVPNGEPVIKEEGEGYLKSNELEIGMGTDSCLMPRRHLARLTSLYDPGIHNEPGHSKAVIPTASKLVDELIETLTNTNDKERSYLDFKRTSFCTLSRTVDLSIT
jgi:dihydroxyacetone kinase